MNGLIIVESPAKAKTISALLPQYETIATRGHMLDLPKHELGLEIKDESFSGDWRFLEGKRKLMSEISQKAKKHSIVYLAVDDDREGEWIAKQVEDGALKGQEAVRIVFHEITKSAIEEAISANTRSIDMNVVNAAHRRRYVDREIGYPMSDIIKYDFMQKESPHRPRGIGRTLSPAIKVIADNHERIEDFVPEAYRQIAIDYAPGGHIFRAIVRTRFLEEHKEEMDDTLFNIRNTDHIVTKYHERTRDIAPYPPLVTARLVRSAYYLFGYKPKQTMSLAQSLYEKGLITYMRTDSIRLSDEAVFAIIKHLNELFPPEYVMQTRRNFRVKSRNVQGAHEAIRPTAFDHTVSPDEVKKRFKELSEEELKLYEFVWHRTLATQMSNAIYDASKAEIRIGEGLNVEVEANNVIFEGWQSLQGAMLKEAERNEEEEWKDKQVFLPRLEAGQMVSYIDLMTIDKTTRAPARYGVGRFVTEIESFTRPSTIDTIVDKMEEFGYVEIRKGMLYITSLGLAIDTWTTENAVWLSDRENTVQMEEVLDLIGSGESDDPDKLLFEYHALIEELKRKIDFKEREYWPPSDAQVAAVKAIAKKNGVEPEKVDDVIKYKKSCEAFLSEHSHKRVRVGTCPECKIHGRKGDVFENEKMYGCSEYKNGCTFTVWKSGVTRLLQRFGKSVSPEEMNEIIKKGLTTRPLLMEGLVGSKGAFDARLVVKKNLQYGWQIEFSFPRKDNKKEV